MRASAVNAGSIYFSYLRNVGILHTQVDFRSFSHGLRDNLFKFLSKVYNMPRMNWFPSFISIYSEVIWGFSHFIIKPENAGRNDENEKQGLQFFQENLQRQTPKAHVSIINISDNYSHVQFIVQNLYFLSVWAVLKLP